MWQEHAGKVSSGEIARIDGKSIRIDASINNELKKEVESFLNAAVRVLKQGMQTVATEFGADLGFLFQKQTSFDAKIAALRGTDPLLADYLDKTRGWSETLIQSRNAIEHKGWKLPPIGYEQVGKSVKATAPLIEGKPFPEFVSFMLNRLCSFVEEFTAYQLQKRMPAEITICEIPLAERPAELPERFRVTLTNGGNPRWTLAYHVSKFEDT
jgi:hypothetical protein